jgi:hypothetical protein
MHTTWFCLRIGPAQRRWWWRSDKRHDVPTVTLSVTGCGSDETVWRAALPAGGEGAGEEETERRPEAARMDHDRTRDSRMMRSCMSWCLFTP